MRRIIQSSETKKALREIYLYTVDHWGEEQAERYHLQFKAAFKKLAENPRLGHRHPNVPEAYLVYPCGSHWIVYRAEPGTLFVVAVLHQSMDLAARLESLNEKYRFR